MKKIAALLFVLFPLLAISQNTYQPGYFIENNGAKKECLIKNLAWKDNPTSFEYKLTEADEPLRRTITDVAEFNVNGYKFRRFTTDLDRSSSIVNELDMNKEPQWKKETLFLKSLVEGKATLYEYTDGNIVKYFASSGDHSTAGQLVYKQYRTGDKVGENNLFRGQLYDIMKNDIKDPGRFKYLDYNKDELIKLFLEYNGNTGEKMNDLSDKQNKSTFNLKVVAGVNYTSASIFEAVNVHRSYDFDSKPTVRLGVEAELILPFNNSKWSLFVDPNYQQYKTDGQDNYSKWELDYKVIEVPMGVRHYMYLNAKSKIFIDASYVIGLNLSGSELHFADLTPHSNYTSSITLSNTSNFALGAGFSYGRYSVAARYNFKREILNNYVLWGVEYSSVGILLGYKIL
jgi:hypothetical protein